MRAVNGTESYCMSNNGSIEIDTDRVQVLGCSTCGADIQVEHLEPFTLVRCPKCQHEMRVPAKLGQFLLLKELGRGAMGAVYEGYDSTLKRLVAIKVMQKKLGDNKEFVDKFLGEAQALAAINHRNVVQVYSCGQEKGQPYIVMEFVDGGRVDQMMRDQGQLDEMLCLRIGLDVSYGLNEAAKIGLVHGDVKGENMLRDREHNTKVVDFGLARFTTGKKQEPGAIWGTPFYIAPEVLQGKAPDQKSDIYSLGATLFHLMTGAPPFNGKTTRDVVLARLQEPAPNIKTVNPAIHDATANLVARMLEADPFRRYPNYGSLIADFQETLDGIKPAEVVHHHKKKKKRPVASLVLAAVAVMLAIVFGAMVVVRHASRKNQPPPKPTGPTVTRLIDGKLVTIPLAEAGRKADAKEGTPEVKTGPVTTKDGKGGDTFIQGAKDGAAADNFGAEQELWVKAGKEAGIHLVRKVYMKFDLSGRAAEPVKDAELVLTVGGGGKNANKGAYQLMLWGLKSYEDWPEGGGGINTLGKPLTWDNAPGNDPRRAGKMGPEAMLLMQRPVEANPEMGKPISFKNSDSIARTALVDYINNRKGNLVTFMVTGDENNEHRAGWKFAAKEHPFLDAPKLILDGKE
ncbi:MAG: serine/threonine protein kinase [Spartobacteria bacterium]|nr:serine/threonine protein kinase [Spartobacteria bacterium]